MGIWESKKVFYTYMKVTNSILTGLEILFSVEGKHLILAKNKFIENDGSPQVEKQICSCVPPIATLHTSFTFMCLSF